MAGETDNEGLRRYLLLVSVTVLYGAGFVGALLPYNAVCLAAAAVAGWVIYLRNRQFPSDLTAIVPLVGLVHPLAQLVGFPEVRLAIFPLMVTVGAVFPIRTLFIVALFGSVPFVVGAEGLVPMTANAAAVVLSCILPALFLGREKKERQSLQRNLASLTKDARDLGESGLQEATSFLQEDTFQELVGSVIEIRQNLDHTLYLVKNVIPCNTVAYFSLEDGTTLNLRSFLTDSPPVSDRPIKVGDGYVGLVALQRKAIRVTDLRKQRMQPGYYREKAGLGSLIAVPVMEDHVLLGVLAVDSDDDAAFFDKDQAILELFAREIVGILRKARTYTQIQSSARGFKALHDISSELITTIKLSEIARKLVTLSGRVVSNDFCILFLVHSPEHFQILASKGHDPKDQVHVKEDSSMLSWLARGETKLFHVSDLQRQPARVLPFEIKGLRTFVSLPLIHEKGVEAILSVGSRKPDAFAPREIELLKVLGNLAAVSIANARLHREIEKMANRDGLTGLFNHRHFQERLSEEFSRLDRYPGNLSFLLMDIDHFKRVNDNHGHPAGDAVLKGVARILQSTLRSAADFPARYGGEEFAAVLVNTDAAGAVKIAERLRKEVERETFKTESGALNITLSVGICTYPTEATSKLDLIERADQALYHAKRSGRNRCVRFKDVPSHEFPDQDDDPLKKGMSAWDRP